MILLGIETATELVGAALADDAGRRSEVRVSGRRRHAEALAPAIEEVLALSGFALGSVTDLAVDVGPGLFTGLRVGVATAQGLGRGLGIGVWPCNSLEVLARAALDDGCEEPVAAVVDARRGEVFAALYAPGPSGEPAEGGPSAPMVERSAPALYRPDELAACVAQWARSSSLRLVGDGARRYGDDLAPLAGVRVGGELSASPTPGALLTVASERRAAGAAAVPAASVLPLYLRDADARSNWTQRSPVARG